MRTMLFLRLGGSATTALAVAVAIFWSDLASAAQEPTPAGRLGGGAPLDATAPASTPPPTATPARSTATPGSSPVASATASSATPAASPAATPVAGGTVAGGTVAPAACDVAPRSLDDVAALLMLPTPPAAPPAPSAADWDPAARAEAEAVVAELAACGDAGAQLAAYALLTDAVLVDYLVGSPPDLGTLRTLLFDDTPALVPATVTGLETRAAEPGAVYLWLDLGDGEGLAVTVSVARERGAWRAAGITIAEPTV